MSMDLLLSVYPNSINRHSTNKTIKYRIKHCGLDFEEKWLWGRFQGRPQWILRDKTLAIGRKFKQRKDYMEPYKYGDYVIDHVNETISEVKGGSIPS